MYDNSPPILTHYLHTTDYSNFTWSHIDFWSIFLWFSYIGYEKDEWS